MDRGPRRRKEKLANPTRQREEDLTSPPSMIPAVQSEHIGDQERGGGYQGRYWVLATHDQSTLATWRHLRLGPAGVIDRERKRLAERASSRC